MKLLTALEKSAHRGSGLFNAAAFRIQRESGCFSSSWSSKDVRSTFIDFFKSHGHTYITPCSVIPGKGEGTYFTNAGMNQFKPIFLGELEPSSKFSSLKRAVNSQKCIRLGGKHNDLEDVGRDMTHHTLFEMLGNWSFGDYFKKDACTLAYKLLIERYGLSPERLYFSYFGGDPILGLEADHETRDIWTSIGMPPDRVLPFGAEDNFWEMGQVGPCGPCTEIHYDHVGGRHAGSEVNSGSPNVVEIWNLVFIQYNRQSDSSLCPLPTHHVDTGMGLERMTAVLNNTEDNYNTDLFLPMFDIIRQTTGCAPYTSSHTDNDVAYRTLTDHIRMGAVAITDGLLPSNEDLGHKLRDILHRCVHLCREHFRCDPDLLLPQLISQAVRSLGEVFPEMISSQSKVLDVVKASVEHHDKSLEHAARCFQKVVNRIGKEKIIPGTDILSLERGHFGNAMALDTIMDLATKRGLTLDMQNYLELVDQVSEDMGSREVQRPGRRVEVTKDISDPLVTQMLSQGASLTSDHHKHCYSMTEEGYDFHTMAKATSPGQIVGMSCQGQTTQSLSEGCQGEIILDRTCFYAKSGGQEADNGILLSQTGKFQVTDVQRHKGYIVHFGVVEKGSLQAGQDIYLDIAQGRREMCMRNHTATHLLNASLSQLLSKTQQLGSSVTHHRLTFDFMALSPLSTDQVQHVESSMRKMIEDKLFVGRAVMSLEDALQLDGVLCVQNKEYPSEVSVITVGAPDKCSVSTELCGGTHVTHTDHLQDVCITHVSAQSQSVRRITCVTGDEAELAHINGDIVKSLCELLDVLVARPGHSDPSHRTECQGILQQGLSYHSALQDMLLDLLQVDANNVTGCRDKWKLVMLDVQKAQELTQSAYSKFDSLDEETMGAAALMKHLVAILNKFFQLELLPKTCRDVMDMTLEKLSHKVATLYNTAATHALRKIIDTAAQDGLGQDIVCVSQDLDLDPRKIVKTVSQMSCERPVLCVQTTDHVTEAVISLPLQTCKPLSDEGFDWLIRQCSMTSQGKGKVANQTSDQVVYSLTVKGRLSDRRILTLLREVLKERY